MRRIFSWLLAIVLVCSIVPRSTACADNARHPEQWRDIVEIAACGGCVFGLRSDGTVLRSGGDGTALAQVDQWSGIRELVADDNARNPLLVGITGNGTVVSTSNAYTSDWRHVDNVVTCKGYWIAGIRPDGSVLVTRKGEIVAGNNGWNTSGDWLDVSSWNNLMGIFPLSGWGDANALAGVHGNGTVVVTAPSGYDYLKTWSGIFSLCCCVDGVFGLRRDGTLAVPPNVDEMYSGHAIITAPFSQWRDLVNLYPGYQDDLFALTQDGKVCAVFSDREFSLYPSFENWDHIKSLFPAYNVLIGLRTDGTLVWEGDRALSVLSGWRNIEDLMMTQRGSYLCAAGLRTDGTVSYAEMDVF